MKTMLTILAAGFACIVSAPAAEPAKPLVTLTVKKHVLDRDHDQRGLRGSSEQKSLTLRVEIVNTSPAAIEGAELSGHALIMRAGDFREMLIKESLGTIKVPAMKPNEKLTLELGKIDLREIERRARKFEESLEEWRVVCTRGGVVIAKAESSDKYTSLEKDAKQPVEMKRAPKAVNRRGRF
jgi:hypothetical protein